MTDNNNETTGRELADQIDTVAANLARLAANVTEFIDESRRFQQDMRVFHAETQTELKDLRAGMFMPEEKETLLNMVDHINERLENDALGKRDVTLTRTEYDATAVAAGFPNRFTQHRPRIA
jgi:hypothetical protein